MTDTTKEIKPDLDHFLLQAVLHGVHSYVGLYIMSIRNTDVFKLTQCYSAHFFFFFLVDLQMTNVSVENIVIASF